jgi:signal transduction histidine kinase
MTDEYLASTARSAEAVRIARELGIQAIALVPIKTRGAVIGVMILGSTDPHRRFDRHELRLAEELAAQAGLALENARLYKEALDARQRRDEMLSIVSHDLRSPLAAIQLSADSLAEQGARVDAIKRSVGRADRLIEDLLTTALVDAGRLTIEKKPEPTKSVIDELIALHRAQAEAKKITLAAELSAAPPELMIDHHHLLQALDNLVGNALKFTPAGGRVTVSVAAEPMGVLIRVQDTGVGIPSEHLPHVFDRFWQGLHARRAGAGLGLAIVKGVIEAHSGHVTVTSEVSHGTTFEVRLPAYHH